MARARQAEQKVGSDHVVHLFLATSESGIQEGEDGTPVETIRIAPAPAARRAAAMVLGRYSAVVKPRMHWSGLVGGFGIAAGLIAVLTALDAHDGERMIAGGILVIGGALLRIEAAIRTYRAA